MAQMTMIQAITDAMRVEMKRDEKVLLFGEDVGKNGGVFRATEGLQDELGEDRVFDTPLAESGIGGLAIGLGLTGFRPIMEVQFFGFVFEVFDSIAAQMARMRYRSGGAYSQPITIRSPFGGGVKTPELHADSLEGLMAQTPGLKVVIPSTPYDAKGLLISAIRDNDPVVFLEHMKLYRSFRGEVPEGEYTIELGKADVKREGTDVSIITYGAMVHTSLKAAEELEKENINVEVIDLMTVSPLDIDTIVESVKKTGRAIVVQEAQRQAGIAANVVTEIQERAILHLEAPVLRVTAPDTVFAFAQGEDAWLPDHKDVVAKVKEVINF
ncbi:MULTISPECIES: alpha-ketoacid dehydrogenase subunit beta [Exiguobacterium]|jgi:pyruvate dehydrogenase E1 component beta subunit|uniref:2-oxoisovalerate dehydrogenase subunit beta n=2 Tax=Exiguobacterium TaxID=33986 RepID=U1LUW3_9BACL|nr:MULTISPECIES: alpha-ketoacid dehydrogenase subunit beta [Exiguobacterium]ERG66369.1 2-oxoisovalerate dehydrogenase subunit beta [Exiguobacterium chiriqhucha RW-2]KAB2861005.1 MAG: alpha-ketoacid dehydrogenase subunit beta [Exiguobacterium chiriqhucha]MCT4776135.1 alpha-ketoacid dehydrogenase subunit beta [Exiguobacterium aquaticum]MCT4788963.1 alpha-ketoacid dehydrogenase subunit beta [Exiguobacterium mexicanum]MDL5375738.1 alpha-ketoacid dehydrogenase subunit beta [Exiguobacterium mexicanu